MAYFKVQYLREVGLLLVISFISSQQATLPQFYTLGEFLRHLSASTLQPHSGIWASGRLVSLETGITILNICTFGARAQNKESRPKMIDERRHPKMIDSGSLNLKEKGRKMQGKENIWRSSMTMSQQQNEQ